MKSIIEFFSTRRALVMLVAVLSVFAFGVPAFAAPESLGDISSSGNTGPFQAFVQKAVELFGYTRNVLFILAAFAFIEYAWSAIKEGKLEPAKLLWLIVALALLGVATFIVTYFAGTDGGEQLRKQANFGTESY